MTATTKSTTAAKAKKKKHANKQTDKRRKQYEDKHARMAQNRHGIFSLSQITQTCFSFSQQNQTHF